MTGPTNQPASTAGPAIWLFQANPRRKCEAFTQVDFARHFSHSRLLTWGCRQHWREVSEGDIAIIFFTGRDGGGIFGVGEVIKGPAGPGDEVVFALSPKTTRYLIANPLTYDDVSSLNLGNMRMRKMTVYRVSARQWAGVVELLARRAPGLGEELDGLGG